MVKIAEVIVDVPTMQTDQPFSYIIPKHLVDVIEKGMRVVVPFGSGGRKVQGFVMAVSDRSFEAEKETTFDWKELLYPLDLLPVVNEELLLLAEEIKTTTFSFKITCLQTMLPSVMRSSYEKFIRITDEIPTDIEEKIFKGREEVPWCEVEKHNYVSLLTQLKKDEKIEIYYEVKTKNKLKTETFFRTDLSFEKLEEEKEGLRKSARQKKKLLSFLQTLSDKKYSVKKAKDELGFTRSILNDGEKRGWLEFVKEEVYRDPYRGKNFASSSPLPLTTQQKAVIEPIQKSIKEETTNVFLLEGITGSGKTEIYLQVIADVLAKGQSAIMLVPEISLTPQTVTRFKSRFGEEVAVLHSGLSHGEKYDEWRKIERKEAHVVVGARSAIFAPLENIGVIIIDEEHESSYKQEETPRYHARNLAVWRSRYHNCPLILGSATPSLESRARAQKKVYTLLTLSERANAKASLPDVKIVDMRKEFEQGNLLSFSTFLLNKIEDRLQKKEQVVLLLNRRGYSSFVMCRDCGFVLPCPHCDISLTLHMDTKTMKCHYCGHEESIPQHCPSCNSRKIRYYGTGTQKVEEELKELIPAARIIRMDVDTTRKKGAHERILETFGNRQADILLGTQMIAKGLDFANVTLVGVLNADTSLNLPDFRSSERTFQLLTQVSGRAGRGDKAGEVVIQTFNPQHYAIQLAKQQNFEGFYQKEMIIRHQGNYPPYYFTVQIVVSHTDEKTAAQKIYTIHQELTQYISEQSMILGPTPKPILRVKNRYFYQLLIKYKKEEKLTEVLQSLLIRSQMDMKQGVRITIDVEPTHFI